ncbi:MAG: hypothetical protein ABS78_15465 [Phenylobacterium sp. SCN 70-31]|nr:MAG: hypothetical protein ABS78_15465 [Phenylobacterium sp. SCN 70-31]
MCLRAVIVILGGKWRTAQAIPASDLSRPGDRVSRDSPELSRTLLAKPLCERRPRQRAIRTVQQTAHI